MKNDKDLGLKQEMVDGKLIVGEYQMEVPNTLFGKIKVLLSTTWGKFIFYYLKIRYNHLILAFKPLAVYLEKQVFPKLRDRRVKWLTIKPGINSQSEVLLTGYYEDQEIDFPGTERFHRLLETRDIRALEFDTYLESNQLMETMLMLFWAIPVITDSNLKTAGFWTWKRKAIAGGMLTKSGFHRFCADMRFNLESRIFQVDYTYCELYMARLVKSYARSFSRFSDHRAYFALAPIAAIVSFLIFSLPLLLIVRGYSVWEIYWIPAVVLPPVGAWATMHVLGAMQYGMEHSDQLLSEYIRQERVLARFPEVNPNPVYKISKKGEVIYINPAGNKLLGNASTGFDKVESVLPMDYVELSKKSLKEQEPLDFEFAFKDRVFRYQVSPFQEDQTVLFVAHDITYLRKIENELRNINANLESLVQERTEELQLTQEATITSLASLAEVRDPETGEHIERTRLYVRALANHLKNHPRFRESLDERTIRLLYNSAPLHDIGKVGIPDAILLKPGRHSDDEFEFMKKHASLGAVALTGAIKKLGFDSFLNIALEIAEGHHERWNGNGYPKGLKGDDIPISARLMALADVYDALISKRVYKPAFSHDKAREMIIQDRGEHFDPDIVDAFLEIEDEFKAIAAQFPDQG